MILKCFEISLCFHLNAQLLFQLSHSSHLQLNSNSVRSVIQLAVVKLTSLLTACKITVYLKVLFFDFAVYLITCEGKTQALVLKVSKALKFYSQNA